MKLLRRFLMAVVMVAGTVRRASRTGLDGGPAPAKANKGRCHDGSRQARRHAAPPEKPPLRPGEWEPFVDPEGQIFPSLLLASATIKDPLRDKATAEKAEEPRSPAEEKVARRQGPRRPEPPTARKSSATRTACSA